MFWRRKKKEDTAEDPRPSFVALSPDEVADALLGHAPDQETSPASGAAQGEEFYFEAESDEAPSAESALTSPGAAPEIVASTTPVAAELAPEASPTAEPLQPAAQQAPETAEDAPEVVTPHAAVTQLLSFLNSPTGPQGSQAEVTPEVAAPLAETLPQDAAVQLSPAAALSAAPLPVSNLDWNLEALRGLTLEPQAVAQAMSAQWEADGLKVQERDALRLARNAIVRVPLVLSDGQQEFWVFMYAAADEHASAHFVAVERKANIFGAVAVYLAPTALSLGGVEPAQLPLPVSASLSVWPADKPFPAGEYALWWPSKPGEHLTNTEEGRLLTRIFTLQDEAASLLYGVLSEQLDWDRQEGTPLRRELPERTQYLQVMDAQGRPMILSAAQEKGVRLHLPRSSESEEQRGQWLALTEQYLKLMVQLLLSASQPLDTLWHDYETRPSQWWKAAQQVLDLRLDIGDDLSQIHVGHVAEEQAAEG